MTGDLASEYTVHQHVHAYTKISSNTLVA